MFLTEFFQNKWQNLDEVYKKLILSVLFILLTAFFSYLIFIFFFKSKEAPKTSPVGLPDQYGRLPTADLQDILAQRGVSEEELAETAPPALPPARERPTEIAQGGKTFAPEILPQNTSAVDLSTNGSLRFYDQTNNKFFKLTPAGDKVEMSSREFPNVQNVAWSPKSDEAILEFPDGSNIYYNFNNNKTASLPREAEGFNFASAGNEIAYKFVTANPDDNWLVVASPDGSNSIAVEHLGDQTANVVANWSPAGNVAGLYRKSSGLDSQEIFLLGKSGENFKSISAPGRGFEAQWAPGGKQMLYSVYSTNNGYRPELHIVSAQGDDIGRFDKSLNLRTWPEKCVFAGDGLNLYCAAPLYLEQGSGIYKEVAADVPDTIYKINVKTGYKERIARPVNESGFGFFTVSKLMLAPDESYLYFSEAGGGVKKIRLK